MTAIIKVFGVLGGLGLFLYGLEVMSSAIQKRAGGRMRNILDRLTHHRLMGVVSGFSVTSIIQSSSATTVILVSLINAGLVTLQQGVGVIMGANIGTTMTAWIVSLIGFKANITALALPAIAIAMPMFFSKKQKPREIACIMIGFGVLFIGLNFMKNSVPRLDHYPEALAFSRQVAQHGILALPLFVLVGIAITVLVQSSSAAMAITLTLGFKGWISFPLAAAMVLGENIGTTITANIAAVGMNSDAKRAALIHTLFNLFGACWVLLLYYPFLHLVNLIVPGPMNDPQSMPIRLAAFHTVFNVLNTAILIGFVPQITELVENLLPRKYPTDAFYRLPYVPPSAPESVESNLITVRKELGDFSERVHAILLKVLNMTQITDPNKCAGIKSDILAQENYTDDMQEVISRFLTGLGTSALSENQTESVSSFQRIAHELESIADSSLAVAMLLDKKTRKGYRLHKTGVKELMDFISQALDFLRYNADYLSGNLQKYDFDAAFKMEKAMNTQRDVLRKRARSKLNKGADVDGELLYMDVVRHLEHIGDSSLNISDAIRETRII